MNANAKARGAKEKSNAFGFGPMGRGMSEMMKCCSGQGSFPDCLTMVEEMKKQCCTPHKNKAESEKKKK
jgi:pentatricopeptide repeat protein